MYHTKMDGYRRCSRNLTGYVVLNVLPHDYSAQITCLHSLQKPARIVLNALHEATSQLHSGTSELHSALHCGKRE